MWNVLRDNTLCLLAIRLGEHQGSCWEILKGKNGQSKCTIKRIASAGMSEF